MNDSPLRKKMIFEGSPEMLAHLQGLMATGELDRCLGLSVVGLQTTETSPQPVTIHLGEWLRGQLTAGWQALEALLEPDVALALLPRGSLDHEARSVSAGRQITWDGLSHPVVLLVMVQEVGNGLRSQAITLHPTGQVPYLPEGVMMVLRSQHQTILQSVQAHPQDNYIKLKQFQAKIGTPFTLEITRHGTQLALESFVI